MKPPKIGRVVFSLTVSAESLRNFADGCLKAAAALRLASARLSHQRAENSGANWWQRGEPQPGYTAQVSEPEWWQDGDEPPPFGLAA